MTKPSQSRLDRAISAVAPQWGLRRAQSRAALARMQRHYEAAGTGRRTSNWHRRSTDANAALAGSLVRLREISRDLRRNNGWARRAVEVIAGNVVGWGIEPRPTVSRERHGEFEPEVLRAWNEWAGTPACDYDGRMPFRGLQRLIMEAVVESGEALIVREPTLMADPPMRMRVLEGDYLDHQRDGVSGQSGPIVQGIELDGNGNRVAYWLYTTHPGANRLWSQQFASVRVPAERVIHVYRVDRPGQMRGVPWLAAAIAKLKDLDEYEDAALMKAKIEACFSAFVKNPDGDPAAIGDQDDEDKFETLEPGMINYLNPGEDVDFAHPTSTSDFGSFTASNLRRVSASLDIPYEELTADYSQVNFSSARMARLSHWRSVESWRWNLLIPQLDHVWRWWAEMAGGLNGWPEMPGVRWSPPPPPMLDPQTEARALTAQVRSGQKTLREALRERGKDPDSHLQEIADTNEVLDQLGVHLDVDPRRVSGAGVSQARAPGSGYTDDDGEQQVPEADADD